MRLVLNPKSITDTAYWDDFLSIVKNYPKDGLFLEIGAADKDQVRIHAGIFSKLIGLNLYFSRLPKSPGVQMINADAQFLPFKNNVFDGVISHHVMEHIENDGIFLNELERILKKGGFAIMGTPNRKRLTRAIAEIFTGERKFPWWEHKREYVSGELLDLAKRSGFQNVYVHSKFLGIHTYMIILGFSCYPRILDKWCNFLFLTLTK